MCACMIQRFLSISPMASMFLRDLLSLSFAMMRNERSIFSDNSIKYGVKSFFIIIEIMESIMRHSCWI